MTSNMRSRSIAAGLALALSACSPASPVLRGQAPEIADAAGASMEKSTLYLDFVAQNLPRTLAGQILPLQMVLFPIDPATGQRLDAPPWSLGLCEAPALGCESGEIKTLRLRLPPGDYAIGYLGSTGFASPAFYLMDFDDPEMIGGRVLVGGLEVTPEFSRNGQATARTPILTLRANEVAYAGLLSAAFGQSDLTTTITASPERRAALLAETGVTPAALVDRPTRYR
jgi:hypothetical protein